MKNIPTAVPTISTCSESLEVYPHGSCLVLVCSSNFLTGTLPLWFPGLLLYRDGEVG